MVSVATSGKAAQFKPIISVQYFDSIDRFNIKRYFKLVTDFVPKHRGNTNSKVVKHAIVVTN